MKKNRSKWQFHWSKHIKPPYGAFLHFYTRKLSCLRVWDTQSFKSSEFDIDYLNSEKKIALVPEWVKKNLPKQTFTISSKQHFRKKNSLKKNPWPDRSSIKDIACKHYKNTIYICTTLLGPAHVQFPSLGDKCTVLLGHLFTITYSKIRFSHVFNTNSYNLARLAHIFTGIYRQTSL